MKTIMNTCVNGVIKLIRAQVDKVGTGKSRRVKVSAHARSASERRLTMFRQNLLLVGGFGASPYLQQELEKSMTRKHIDLHRPAPDKS